MRTVLLMAGLIAISCVPLSSAEEPGALDRLSQDATVASAIQVKITSGCDGGVVYDDGVYENGYGGTSTFGFTYFGQRTTPPFSAAKLEKLCVCLQRLS